MKTMDHAILGENDRRAIVAAGDILRARFPVEQIILFGSKARGNDDPESDIDLLVLTRRKLTWAERDQLIDSLYDLQLEMKVVISPLIIPREQWDHGEYRVLPLRHEIERDGIAA